jgi:hypothetical protein
MRRTILKLIRSPILTDKSEENLLKFVMAHYKHPVARFHFRMTMEDLCDDEMIQRKGDQWIERL